MIAKVMYALWTLPTLNHACGVFFGAIIERTEMTLV